MNGYECGGCDMSPCICAEEKAREEERKASVRLGKLEKDTNELYFALTKPKGLRLKLLRWLYPEITRVADSLRKCYWAE
ncbi:hypothetical protein LCGC14_0475980 [marine sediment metagenome]|uniref:Uncharacterized protein n=1 Tax=marine sediment metagenome TaxID=412755 RepID=A0A0F9UXR4_9ZZZZ